MLLGIYFTIACAFIIIILAVLLTPFPHWPTYYTIWKHIFFDPEPSIKFRHRKRQVFYLLNYALKLPFVSLCWCLDEILFSQYREMKLSTPIFIVAQPRSATTFLHRTLASDEKKFFSICLLEWRYPSILIQKFFQATGYLEKMSKVNYWGNNNEAKLTEKMHYSYLNDYEDDGFLYEECFFHQFYVINRFPYPKLVDKLNNFQELPNKTKEKMLKAHYQVIQKILYLRGGNLVYVSKDNECLQRSELMKKLYPDALFITITRESEKFMNSYITLIHQSAYSKSRVDVNNISEWISMQRKVRVEAASQTINFFESLSEEQKLCFSFNSLTENIKDSIELVYRKLNIDLTEAQSEYLKNLDTKQNLRDSAYKTGSDKFEEFAFFDKFATKIARNHKTLLEKSKRI